MESNDKEMLFIPNIAIPEQHTPLQYILYLLSCKVPCSCISNVKKPIQRNYDVGIIEGMIKKKKFCLKAKHPSLYMESLKAIDGYFISQTILVSLGHMKISPELILSLHYSMRRIIVPVRQRSNLKIASCWYSPFVHQSRKGTFRNVFVNY